MTAPALAPAVYARAKASVKTWHDDPGYCLRYVRTMVGAPAMGGDAHSAWSSAQHRHLTGTPPRGVPVFWQGGRHGHVAVSAGAGKVYTTDYVRRGRVDLVPIATISKGWGLTYRGWTEDVNGVRVVGFDIQTPPKLPAHAGHVPWHRTLRHGAKGADVKDLQRHLGARHPSGTYGRWSMAKVKAVQRKAAGALGTADGVVGPKTWRAITGHK